MHMQDECQIPRSSHTCLSITSAQNIEIWKFAFRWRIFMSSDRRKLFGTSTVAGYLWSRTKGHWVWVLAIHPRWLPPLPVPSIHVLSSPFMSEYLLRACLHPLPQCVFPPLDGSSVRATNSIVLNTPQACMAYTEIIFREMGEEWWQLW